jgi:site-specific DNA recombinase
MRNDYILIYPRVSLDTQKNNASFEAQETECRALVEQLGLADSPDQIVMEREIHSATENLKYRPVWNKYTDLILANRVKAVVVWHSDRWARDPLDLVYLYRQCTLKGIKCYSVTNPEVFNEDTDDAFFAMRITMQGTIQQQEAKSIKRRMNKGAQIKVEKHHKLLGCGSAVYGYRHDNPHGEPQEKKSRYVIYEPEAKVVRWIFDWYINEHLALRKICDRLNHDPLYKTLKRSNNKDKPHTEWWPTTVLNILQERKYKGEAFGLQWREEKWEAIEDGHPVQKRRPVKRPESEWIVLNEGTVPAIVDTLTWELAQREIVHRKERGFRTPKRPQEFLLRDGFAYCASCGAKMYSLWNGKDEKNKIYVCGNKALNRRTCPSPTRIHAHLVDPFVWSAVERFLNDPGNIRRLIEEQRGELTANPVEKEKEMVRTQLLEVAKRITALDALITRLVVNNPDLPEIAASQEKEKGVFMRQQLDLRARLADLEAREADWITEREKIDALESHIAMARGKLSNLDLETKRIALEWLGIKVTVNPVGRIGRKKLDTPRWTMSSDFAVENMASVYRSVAPPERNNAISSLRNAFRVRLFWPDARYNPVLA